MSSEEDIIDLFDAASDGAVARRGGAAVAGRRDRERDREQTLGPSVTGVDFSPDGRVLLTSVEAHTGSELRFMNVADGQALYRLKFEEIYAAQWRPMIAGDFPPPEFSPPPSEAGPGTLAGAVSLEVELMDRENTRKRIRVLQARLREIERLKARGREGMDVQQSAKVDLEGEVRSSLAKLEAEMQLLEQPDRIVFEIHTPLGIHLLTCHVGDSCRDLARRFCREHRLDPPLAAVLADRMERRLPRRTAPGLPADDPPAAPVKRHGPPPKVIDLGDKDAVRRRVRALQKKVREIEKLKLLPESALDQLQSEKLATEAEVRRACAALEHELDLLERLPLMVFDVETEAGTRFIEFRDGDDCLELARQFCETHSLDEELVELLAAHMEDKLRVQAILHDFDS